LKRLEPEVARHHQLENRLAPGSNPCLPASLVRTSTPASRLLGIQRARSSTVILPPAASALQGLVLNGQSCLQRLSDETGGRAFFQGTAAPVSFGPFLREIDLLMSRQLALTYRSTHPKKGFHKLDIKPLEQDVEIRHPAGYTR